MCFKSQTYMKLATAQKRFQTTCGFNTIRTASYNYIETIYFIFILQVKIN